MKTSAIILSHYKEREKNIPIIVNDLRNGSIKPDEIIIFCDNPQVKHDIKDVSIIRSNETFNPNIRFALGLALDTDYCLFIDDDLTVGKHTLHQFISYAQDYPNAILGFEGSILRNTPYPYTDGITIDQGVTIQTVDVIIRTYFVPRSQLAYGLILRSEYNLPNSDDILLCLGNKYIHKGKNMVIPVTTHSKIKDLSDGSVGQCKTSSHYVNRNTICRQLMDDYQ